MKRTTTDNKWYTRIADPELRLLAALVTERLSSLNEAVLKTKMLGELQERMRHDIVHFVYDKREGEERPAYGTRCPSIIARYCGDPSGEKRDGPLRTFTYFDLKRRAWRSFRPENIISIDNDYEL